MSNPYQVSKAARGWALMLGGKSLRQAAEVVGETPGKLDRMIWTWLCRKPKARQLPDPSACAPATRAVITRVAEQHGLTFDDMMGRALDHRTCVVRHAAMHAVKTERTKLSYLAMARLFGRDHSTIIHGVQTHEARMAWVDFMCWAGAVEQPDLFAKAA